MRVEANPNCKYRVWVLGWGLCGMGNLLSLAVVGAPVRVLLLWDGKGSAVHVAMQRAAMADGACCAGLCSVLRFGVRKTPFPHWACLQPSLDVLAAQS